VNVNLDSLLVVVGVAMVAPLLADLVPGGRLPVVVVELVLGILVGPQVLAWADSSGIVTPLSQFGLAFLFFMAGLEIDLRRVRGRALRLAGFGWAISVGLAFGIAGLLHQRGMVISVVVVGSCLCTTALGTLLPILRDAGEIRSGFGTHALAVGAIGELGPIVLVALLLTQSAKESVTVALLVAFAVITIVLAIVVVNVRPTRVLGVIGQTMDRSGQFAVRLSVFLLTLLVYLAFEFGLDIILGAFAAGLIAGFAIRAEENVEEAEQTMAEAFRHKLDAVAFGVFVPIFFVVSGMQFDLDALLDDPASIGRLPLFLALFLVVRGIPTVVLTRHDLPRGQLAPLGLLAGTGLPLIVAVTHIALQTGRITPDNAAALVGAGMISVLVFPSLALALKRRSDRRRAPEAMVARARAAP
jgi:Kef-type K+ transport system membrane component KefB